MLSYTFDAFLNRFCIQVLADRGQARAWALGCGWLNLSLERKKARRVSPAGLSVSSALRQGRKAQACTVLAVSTYSSIWLKFMYL